jgi:hypothetical protein
MPVSPENEGSNSLCHRPEVLVGDQLAYMFSAACKYQVLGLMAICEKQMERTLTVANAAHCLYVADHVGAKSLKLACLKFIGLSIFPCLSSLHLAAHTTDVVASEGYNDLDSNLCRLILGISSNQFDFIDSSRRSVNGVHVSR